MRLGVVLESLGYRVQLVMIELLFCTAMSAPLASVMLQLSFPATLVAVTELNLTPGLSTSVFDYGSATLTSVTSAPCWSV